jgi:site-specific recombinase XerD
MRTLDLVTDVLAAQRGRRAATTIAAYRSDLHRFARTVSGPVEEITADDLETYLAAIPDVTKTTLARHQASLRALFAWAYRLERLATNPMVRLEGIRAEDHLPRPLDASDIARILAAIPAIKVRDRLLFTLLRDTGIRVGEALSIRWEDVSLDDGDEQVRVLGKRGRERTVLLHAAPDTVRLLRRYKKATARSGYLFQGDPQRGGGGAPLDYSSVHYAWSRYCAHAGVTATIHQLRHAFVTELVRGGMRLTTVQRLAGHRRLETTRAYAEVSDDEVKRELSDFRRQHWR